MFNDSTKVEKDAGHFEWFVVHVVNVSLNSVHFHVEMTLADLIIKQISNYHYATCQQLPSRRVLSTYDLNSIPSPVVSSFEYNNSY